MSNPDFSHSAVFSLYPNVVRVVGLNPMKAYDANGDEVQIDQGAYRSEIARLEAEQVATQYQRDRAEAYASIADQLDMQYWDSVNGTTTWSDHIAAVKAAHPKP